MSGKVSVRNEKSVSDDWTLPDDELAPESVPHDLTIDLLRAIFRQWIASTGRDAQVARNLAVRWLAEQPIIGSETDLCLISPRPPEGEELESLCTWLPGHVAPRLAIEVISRTPRKDYASIPERCAACGVEELWMFDPKLMGPRRHGGPHRLQVWRRDGDGLTQVHAGEAPAWSPFLGAFVLIVDEGRRLRIAHDPAGVSLWPTVLESLRADREAMRESKH